MEEEIRCQNPGCPGTFVIIRGHRRRRYCNDACKQAAHRARLEAARLAEEEAACQARIERERQETIPKRGQTERLLEEKQVTVVAVSGEALLNHAFSLPPFWNGLLLQLNDGEAHQVDLHGVFLIVGSSLSQCTSVHIS